MKPFKTISLVDRLKASTYNDVSELRGKAEPGSPGGSDLPSPPKDIQTEGLKLTQPSAPATVVELKKLPNARKRNAELLKLIRSARPNEKLQVLNAFATKPLVSFILPKANESFANIIKLEDRLAQSNVVKSTKHLPHFFLSDFYTDYIQITRFGVFNHSSITEVNQFLFKPNRDGQDIVPYEFDPIILQGVRLANGQLISLVEPRTPRETILTLQGTFITNGAFVSQTQVEDVSPQSTILTLQGTFFTNGQFISRTQIEDPVEIVAQGGQKAFASISPNVITLMQGIIIDNAGKSISVISVAKPAAVPKPTQEPSKAEYAGDRALSILLPRVKHGSAFLQRQDFGQLIFNQGTLTIQRTGFGDGEFVQIIQQLQGISPDGTESSQVIPTKDFQNKSFDGQTLISTQGEDYFRNNRPATEPFPTTEELLKKIQSFNYTRAGRRQGKGPDANKKKHPHGVPSTGEVKRIGAYNKGSSGSQPKPDYTAKGFIPLSINSLSFPALLTSLSDSWSPSYNDLNFVGRQDTFKTFKGVTRSVSMGFKVVAWSGGAKGMWAKLDQLIKETSVGTPAGPYTKGPIVKLTVGGLFKKVTCVCTSLKIDTNPAEYTWDVDSGHPMVADISIDFAMITSNNNEVFNALTNTYYG